MELWITGGLLLLIWFVCTFLLHKTGFIHLLLLGAIALLVIQWAAVRRAAYESKASEKS